MPDANAFSNILKKIKMKLLVPTSDLAKFCDKNSATTFAVENCQIISKMSESSLQKTREAYYSWYVTISYFCYAFLVSITGGLLICIITFSTDPMLCLGLSKHYSSYLFKRRK